MKIEILGTGCLKCKTLFDNTKDAVGSCGIFAQIEKIEDPIEIMQRGDMTTPALVINGHVVSTGKVLTSEAIKQLLSQS